MDANPISTDGHISRMPDLEAILQVVRHWFSEQPVSGDIYIIFFPDDENKWQPVEPTPPPRAAKTRMLRIDKDSN